MARLPWTLLRRDSEVNGYEAVAGVGTALVLPGFAGSFGRRVRSCKLFNGVACIIRAEDSESETGKVGDELDGGVGRRFGGSFAMRNTDKNGV